MEAGQTSAYFQFLLQGTLCLLFRLKLAWAGRHGASSVLLSWRACPGSSCFHTEEVKL